MKSKLLKNKSIIFIIGQAGSGKTTLCNQLVKQYEKPSVYEDYSFILQQQPNTPIKLLSDMAKVRHTGETIFVNMFPTRAIFRPRFDIITPSFSNSSKITAWIFTSIESEIKEMIISKLEEFQLFKQLKVERQLNKFQKTYHISIEKKRKTRPCLILARDDYFLKSEIKRYKK